MHRFDHKLGIISKSQLTIKAQNLEATLPAIILIRDVFYVSLTEQDTTRKRRVYENATMYEMYEMYKIAEALPVTPNSLHPRWLDL